MSRRDTIIVAVLVNTALLAVLFMLAVQIESNSIAESKPKESFEEIAVLEEKTDEEPEQIQLSVLPAYPRDELDQVLKNYPLQASIEERIESIPEAKPNPNYVEVTVKRGDYLEKIAKANGTTVEMLVRLNKLSSERIDIGQVLKVPIVKMKVAEAPPAPKKTVPLKPEPATIEPQFYVLKSGDNPWKVARDYKVKFDDLLKLNNLDEDKAKTLKPGDTLRVR